MVNALYNATGEEFYVVSFCGKPDDEYTNQNGLLSLWRAYGSVQGYALEFDTEKLEQMFVKEAEKFAFGSNSFGDVIYGTSDQHFDEDFAPKFEILLKHVTNMYLQFLGQEHEIDDANAYTAFCYCAMMLKHEGFREEREVRMAFSPHPHTPEFLLECAQEGISPGMEKPIKLRSRNGRPVPFIEFFGGDPGRLPIKRIVVGPGRHKHQTASALQRSAFARNIPISVCSTPLV